MGHARPAGGRARAARPAGGQAPPEDGAGRGGPGPGWGAAEAFPCWPVLEAAGLRPVETEPFCQAMAVPLALAALRRARILRAQATVALAGQRVSRPLFAAAEALCPQVRRLVVDVPGEGEELAACFGPAGGESGGAVLRLYGPAPQLDGLRLLPEEGTLPPGLAPLPLLTLLWECGRLRPEQIRIFPA